MIYGGCKLKFLPYISKWSTNNVNDINSIFGCCFDLSSLPDISKWNIIILIQFFKHFIVVDL